MSEAPHTGAGGRTRPRRIHKKPALAFSVHLLTATGAVLALLAMLSAAQGAWPMMFAWLCVALLVDGIDGPLARKFDVKTHAARWDGAILDLVIDYLTYVFIPAYAMVYSGLASDVASLVMAVIIVGSGVVYFADTHMKTADKSFLGFPGCWNMAVLVFFAIRPEPWVTVAVVVALAMACFLPLKFIHPVRTRRWRKVNMLVMLVWTGLAGWSAWVSFAQPQFVSLGLMVTSLYLLFAGMGQQLYDRLVGRRAR